jgi:uncharacterized RDD family membrane protein YckC
MKKFDSIKTEIASILIMGLLFMLIAGAIIYGISVLYDINSGLPGAVALIMIGVWVAHDFAALLHNGAMEYMGETDVTGEVL